MHTSCILQASPYLIDFEIPALVWLRPTFLSTIDLGMWAALISSYIKHPSAILGKSSSIILIKGKVFEGIMI